MRTKMNVQRINLGYVVNKESLRRNAGDDWETRSDTFENAAKLMEASIPGSNFRVESGSGTNARLIITYNRKSSMPKYLRKIDTQAALIAKKLEINYDTKGYFTSKSAQVYVNFF